MNCFVTKYHTVKEKKGGGRREEDGGGNGRRGEGRGGEERGRRKMFYASFPSIDRVLHLNFLVSCAQRSEALHQCLQSAGLEPM